jgi:hypothetical protein
MRTPILLLFLVALGCGRRPDSQLNADEKELAAVYSKLVLLQEKLPVEHSAYPDSMQAILDRHGMTRERYDLILASLDRTQEHWLVFYREVQKLLDASPQQPVSPPARFKESPGGKSGPPLPGQTGPGEKAVPRVPPGNRAEQG